MAVTTTPGSAPAAGRWPDGCGRQHATMRRASRLLPLLLVIVGAIAAAGCDAGREVNNPFGGVDHNYRHVGQVDPIPMNGR